MPPLALQLLCVAVASSCWHHAGASAAAIPGPQDIRIEHLGADVAVGVGTPAPRLWWSLPPPTAAARSVMQAAYQIVVDVAASGNVRSASAPGSTPGGGPAVDTGRVASGLQEGVPLGNTTLRADTDYTVRVRWWDSDDGPASAWSAPFNFTTGLFTAADWGGAAWISGTVPSTGLGSGSGGQLRTVFQVPARSSMHGPAASARAGGTPSSAVLFVASRGYRKCWLNGAPVADGAELGHTTTWERTVLYDAHRVGHLLARGADNVLACTLARGFYGDADGGMFQDKTYTLSIQAKLSIRHEDGTRTTVVTKGTGAGAGAGEGTRAAAASAGVAGARPDASGAGGWFTAAGPYTLSRVFQGVHYDTRLETPGWLQASNSTMCIHKGRW